MGKLWNLTEEQKLRRVESLKLARATKKIKNTPQIEVFEAILPLKEAAEQLLEYPGEPKAEDEPTMIDIMGIEIPYYGPKEGTKRLPDTYLTPPRTKIQIDQTDQNEN